MKEFHLTDLPLWNSPEAFKVLKELCGKHNVPETVLEDLVAIQRDRERQGRADGVYEAITEALDQMD